MSLVRLGLSPRMPGLSRQQAQAHWRGVHARLFAQVPGVKSYVQNHAVLDANGEPLLGEPGFDIFSEVEFATEHHMEEAMASAWYRQQVVPDEMLLLDASRRCFVLIGRCTARAASGDDCKLVVFLQGEPRDGVLDARFSVHTVLSTGGAAPRPVDAVIARWCASADDAIRIYREVREVCESGGDGLRIEAAVIVREIEVVPRGIQS